MPSSFRSAQDCPAYILAGGESSRFGSNKSLCIIHNEPQIVRLRNFLSASGHSVTVVGRPNEQFKKWGLECLADKQSGFGPMMGVFTALEYQARIKAGYCLILTCDLAFWDSGWFEHLACSQQEDLPVCFSKDGIPEPFPALYHTHLVTVLRTELKRGQGSLKKFLQSSQFISAVPAGCFPSEWSFNTAAELESILGRLDAHP